MQIIAHPECPPDVLAEADFTGSTAHMINWVRNKHPKRVVMITECSMADNVQAELPDVEMVRPCNLCPHMKRITLPKILDSLLTLREEVTIDPIDRREGAAFGGADDQSEELSTNAVVPANAGTTRTRKQTCQTRSVNSSTRNRRCRHRRRRPCRTVLRAETGAASGHGDFRGAARRRRLDGMGARRHRRRSRRGRQRGGARRRYDRGRRRPGRRDDRAWTGARSRRAHPRPPALWRAVRSRPRRQACGRRRKPRIPRAASCMCAATWPAARSSQR